MDERKDELADERPKSRLEQAYDRVERQVLAIAQDRWRSLVLLAWLILTAYFIWQRWKGINAFGLGDTDDNMRIMQVRAWLHGQGWFDLRQYRLNPPHGANIHWSRLVDLPIAGLILTLRPLLGGVMAEKVAVTVAPLLPLLLLLFSLSLIVRRLVHPLAYVAVFAAIFAEILEIAAAIEHLAERR